MPTKQNTSAHSLIEFTVIKNSGNMDKNLQIIATMGSCGLNW